MAPVVHGLAKEYAGKVDFVYLYSADPKNRPALAKLGFVSTPHFFFLKADGTPVAQFRGVVPQDSMVRSLERLRIASGR